jgi:spore germination cell wall hydrolase CwlJ-like protein
MLRLSAIVLAIVCLRVECDGVYMAPPSPFLDCMARNVYHEARGEGELGMLAVAHVVINRSKDPRWSDDVCEVIYQPQQFSWANKRTRSVPRGQPGSPAERARLLSRFAASAVLAQRADEGQPSRKKWSGIPHFIDPTNGATFYHERSVHPAWARKMKKVAVIGNHVFYKG